MFMDVYFTSVFVLLCVSGTFTAAEEAGWGLGVLRGRHRLSGAVEPLVCLHWWEGGWAGLQRSSYGWGLQLERYKPEGLMVMVDKRWGSSCFFND